MVANFFSVACFDFCLKKLAPSDKSSCQFSLYNITSVNTEIPLNKSRYTKS